jgi:tRNA A-37 threonylcarbamoyl transferase component Bud32
MVEMIVCPQCGAELPRGAPEGLCPHCLLKRGLTDTSGAVSEQGIHTGPYSGAPPVPAPEELARRFPQLEILDLLGQGGMGAVYKARQPGLDRLVALKILPPEAGRDPAFAERFTREARALARLSHPNIVTVYDFGQADGLYFLVMEYVDGLNLRQLSRQGELKPREALKIVPPICDALQFAHDEGVVHRDIKPENILVDKKGRVKIADFGLAKLLGRAPADYQLTGPQQVMGTPYYMAPEQMEHPLEVDHRADIYSLGVVLYELLTGELPLGRFTPPSRKADVDVRLDEVVLRTLEKEPSRRYQSISEIKTQVESICGLVGGRPYRFGYEYRSRTALWGWPLIHIATGFDPATGRRRVARGVLAIGDIAVGGVAIGGGTLGVLAIGGCGIGVVSWSGIAIGCLAVGGFALGGFVFGGFTLGLVALGGIAVGYYAKGGWVAGIHADGGNISDPVAAVFFEPWVGPWVNWVTLGSVGLSILAAIIWLVQTLQRVVLPLLWPGGTRRE